LGEPNVGLAWLTSDFCVSIPCAAYTTDIIDVSRAVIELPPQPNAQSSEFVAMKPMFLTEVVA
jgi:hypothetical protein